MGMFSLPPPPLRISSTLVAYINMIFSYTILVDPWIVSDDIGNKIFGS